MMSLYLGSRITSTTHPDLYLPNLFNFFDHSTLSPEVLEPQLLVVLSLTEISSLEACKASCHTCPRGACRPCKNKQTQNHVLQTPTLFKTQYASTLLFSEYHTERNVSTMLVDVLCLLQNIRAAMASTPSRQIADNDLLSPRDESQPVESFTVLYCRTQDLVIDVI